VTLWPLHAATTSVAPTTSASTAMLPVRVRIAPE
jgi:hypothetical protein